jgi:hypothetical protein
MFLHFSLSQKGRQKKIKTIRASGPPETIYKEEKMQI